jgi:hypothetical protein
MFSRPFPDDAESKGRGFVEKQNRCETMILWFQQNWELPHCQSKCDSFHFSVCSG